MSNQINDAGRERLSDKVAIVTGAGSGFGEAIAHLFADEGAKVALVDINAENARRVASAIGEGAKAFVADVGVRDDVDRAISEVVETFGAPDIVINNAGWTHRNQPLLDIDEETFDKVFRINVKSIYLMTMATVPVMTRGGSIVNVGSTAGIRPRPGLSWYNGTKGAVNILSKSLAVELAPRNIRVNALCPVMGETALLESFMGVEDTPENRERFVSTIPLGRLSRPQDIAKAALYLASDESDFITGVLLPVDGGRTV
ncbi:glucose 1-dehydrogenase [Aureimonas altamirensis]|uniref:glucose 1-dehydrogenase n=1 Tax=Aureimonas altamirensis TaxID=370622 RepID=UPI002036FEF9|nr:glucose 1-dehydrogenase [Aureimonas altamirensis]MCM2505441.1 glucose 1-dehydrogenase [Aureimonas altamirensis]